MDETIQNRIYIGSVSAPIATFDNDSIMSLSMDTSSTVTGNELAYDTLSLTVYSESALSFPYGTKLYYYRGIQYVATFYIADMESVSKRNYRINAVSVLGMLEYETCYGGLFLRETFQNVVNKILFNGGIDSYQYVAVDGIKHTFALGDSFSGVDVAQTPTANGNVTSRSSLYTKFTFLSRTWKSTNTALSEDIPLFGQYDEVNDETYAVMMRFERSSTTVRTTTEGYIGVALGASSPLFYKVQSGDTVEITIDPVKESAVLSINGASHDFLVWYGIDEDAVGLAGLFGYRTSSSGSLIHNGISVSYEYYRVTKPDSKELAIDVVAVQQKANAPSTSASTWLMNNADSNKYMVSLNVGTATIDKFAPYGGGDYNVASISDADLDLLSNAVYNSGTASALVSGWLQVSSKREALHQLLFASCVNIFKGDGDEIIFGYYSNGNSTQIDDDSIYADGSVEAIRKPISVSVTEHSFEYTDPSAVVYDNSNDEGFSTPTLVNLNNAPIYGSLTSSGGLTLIANNCNVAIVTGSGTLSGTPCKDLQTVRTAYMGGAVNGKEITVQNCTLLSSVSAQNVLNKLIAYYNSSVLAKNSIVYNGEKCGYQFSFSDSYGDQRVGILSRMNLAASSIIKATCEFLCGFVPPKIGTDFANYVILTGSGTWTVPSGVEKMRVILIGGGQGGQSGCAGADGMTYRSDAWTSGTPAEGGDYGAGGTPGKVLTLNFNSISSSSYAYSCGTGGAGGSASVSHTEHNDGTLGTDTTFGTFSSANGSVNPGGIVNQFTGERLAIQPNYWNESSGKGGAGGYYTVIGTREDANYTYHHAEGFYSAVTGNTSSGGERGLDLEDPFDDLQPIQELGGAGGGASADSNGGNGQNAKPGIGGNGAKGVIYNAVNLLPLGSGGIGGAGGGGGGSAGLVVVEEPGDPYDIVGGKGGDGAQGTSGRNGCILIYY